MLKVVIARCPDWSNDYGWSNVTDVVVKHRIPKYLEIIDNGDKMELHFDITIPFVALVCLDFLDKNLRDFNFAQLDTFTLNID